MKIFQGSIKLDKIDTAESDASHRYTSLKNQRPTGILVSRFWFQIFSIYPSLGRFSMLTHILQVG